MKEKIYLIPGLMNDQRLWNRITPLLENRYELVHVTIPHNENFDEIVEDLNNIFKEEQINLLGFSLGSYIASYYAVKYPNRVKRLFNVAGTPSGTTIKEVKQRRKKIDYIHINGFKELGYEKTLSLVEVENQKDEELIQLIQDMYNDLGKDVFITQLESTFNRVDILDDLIALQIPVWFFLSLDDRLLNSESLEQLRTRKHNMNIIIREGTSHLIPLEEPDDLCDYIEDWMNSKNLSLFVDKEHPSYQWAKKQSDSVEAFGHIGTHIDCYDKVPLNSQYHVETVFFNCTEGMPSINSIKNLNLLDKALVLFTSNMQKNGYGTKKYGEFDTCLESEVLDAILSKKPRFILIDSYGIGNHGKEHIGFDKRCESKNCFVIENVILNENEIFTIKSLDIFIDKDTKSTGKPCTIIAKFKNKK